MAVQTNTSPKSTMKALIDIFFIGLGILGGGIVALLGLGLWLDYQADPNHSILALWSQTLVAWVPAPVSSAVDEQARLMGLPLANQTSAYWYMARAGGFVAYLLLWLSSVWGLCLSTKVIKAWVSPLVAYGLHEFLSITAILFATLHALALLGDSYIQFNLFHLLIPFIAPYEPFWTGLGIIALDLALVTTASFYVRHLIGQKLWRRLHIVTFLVYLLALLHGLMAGTDSARLGVTMMYAGSGLSVLFLVYYRLLTLRAGRIRA